MYTHKTTHIRKLAHEHILTIVQCKKRKHLRNIHTHTHTYMLPPHTHPQTTHSNSYTDQERWLSFNLWPMQHLFSFWLKHYLITFIFFLSYSMTHFRLVDFYRSICAEFVQNLTWNRVSFLYGLSQQDQQWRVFRLTEASFGFLFFVLHEILT